MPRIGRLLLALLVALAVAQPALTEAKSKAKAKHHAAVATKDAGAHAATVIITADEVTIIYDYIRRNGTGDFGQPLNLPPGIAKKVKRGKPLPPGIEKRYLPGLLVRELPKRQGYQWLVVDRDIVLVAARTGLIADMLKSAI